MPHPLGEIRSWQLRGKRSVDRPALPERVRDLDRYEELETLIPCAIERIDRDGQLQHLPEGRSYDCGLLGRICRWRRPSQGIPDFHKRMGERAAFRIQDGIEFDGFQREQDLKLDLMDILDGNLVQVDPEKDLIDAETVIETGQDDMPRTMHRAEPRRRNDLPGGIPFKVRRDRTVDPGLNVRSWGGDHIFFLLDSVGFNNWNIQ